MDYLAEREKILKIMDHFAERENVAKAMCRLYDKNLTTPSGGNISLKINDELIAITPSSLDKGKLTPEQIIILGLDGKNHTPFFKLSIEGEMHLQIYKNRSDIKAIVHAHPAHATAFTALKGSIDTHCWVESYYILGNPLLVPYAPSGSATLAKRVGEYANKNNVLLLENHGIITLGKTLFEAYDRMELIEKTAEMNLYQLQSGLEKKSLNEQEIAFIDSMHD